MDVNDLSYSFGFHLKELAEHEPERVSASSGISSARGALGECYPRLLSHRPAPSLVAGGPSDRGGAPVWSGDIPTPVNRSTPH